MILDASPSRPGANVFHDSPRHGSPAGWGAADRQDPRPLTSLSVGQPFTAPATRPWMMWRCSAKYTLITGTVAIVNPAIRMWRSAA